MRNRVTEKEARRRARLAELREATRAYRDDQGHTWRETAEHFGIKERATRYRVYKARKEREAERQAEIAPLLPFDEV